MRHAGNEEGPEEHGLFAEIGARIKKSLFIWGLAMILAFLTYTDIVKLARHGPGSGTQPEAPNAAAGGDASIAQNVSASDAMAAGNASSAQDAPERSPGEWAASSGNTDGGERQAAALGNADTSEGGSSEDDPEQEEQKCVALTFDDGPHPVFTERLLDGLKERGVKATFFVVGRNIPGNEELIRRMDEEGHLIGNHTYDHVKISGLSGQEACEQIEKTNRLIRRLTGSDAEFVRPPFGEWNKEMEYSFVMIPVLWDVDPKDWLTRNVSDIVRRVLEDTQSGDIILLHDYYDTSVEAALQIVDRLKEQDYEFVTVDELILE